MTVLEDTIFNIGALLLKLRMLLQADVALHKLLRSFVLFGIDTSNVLLF